MPSLKEDAEKLDKRSVDGSESKSTQWELELQASIEKLNRLSLENSLYVKGSAVPSCVDLRNTPKIDAASRMCYDFLLAGQTNAHSSNQFPKSIKDSTTIVTDTFVDGSSRLQRSCSTINSMTMLYSPSKITSKSNISKSLGNSPVNRSTSNFESGRLGEKMASTDISKYVPNETSQFDIEGREIQSKWVTDASHDVESDAGEEEKGDNSNDKNDSLVDKDHMQLTNLSSAETSCNVEFLSAETNLSDDVSRYSTNSQDNAALLPTWSNRNILHKTASCSANSSPIKLKNSLTIARSSDSEITVQSAPEKKIKTASIKELPLLSLFGRTSALSVRGKSCSMIDLDDKQNLKTLLDNFRLGSIQAVSAERLANVRLKLVNDRSDKAKTDDIKN